MLSSHHTGYLTVAIALLAGAALLGGSPARASDGPQATRPSPGCGTETSAPPGESVARSIAFDELDRDYRLHLPAGYDAENPMPLVLVIHGYTSSAELIDTKYTSFSRHADERGYVVAYPQATAFEVAGTAVTSWNDLACNASPGPDGSICNEGAFDYPTPPECGEPRECDWCSCHDDVGFIVALLDEIERSVCVDLNRVYAAGMSNGAMLVHRLACDVPERFAAVAPVGGTLAKGFNCAPGGKLPISMINFHGARDTTVPFDGVPAEDGFLYTPAKEVMAAWAGPGSQRCSSEDSPYATSKDGVEGLACVQRAGCGTGAEVVDCGWNGGHDWPRKGDDQFSVDVIWEFFEKNGRRSHE